MDIEQQSPDEQSLMRQATDRYERLTAARRARDSVVTGPAFGAIYTETTPAAINPALLMHEAGAVFGDRLVNVDTGDMRGLGVHLARVEEGDAARWEDILRAHDGTRQTPEQIEQAGRAMDVWRWEESAAGMIQQAEADIAAMGSTTTIDEMQAYLVRAISRQVVVMRMLKAR